MKKLTDIICDIDGRTFGELLEEIIKSCEPYKSDGDCIDNPDSLDEVWQKVKECPADASEVSKLLYWISEVWSAEHRLRFQSNLGFRFRPLLNNLGLAISTLTMITEFRTRGYKIIRGQVMNIEKSKELITEAIEYLKGYLSGTDLIFPRIDIVRARINLHKALKELEGK